MLFIAFYWTLDCSRPLDPLLLLFTHTSPDHHSPVHHASQVATGRRRSEAPTMRSDTAGPTPATTTAGSFRGTATTSPPIFSPYLRLTEAGLPKTRAGWGRSLWWGHRFRRAGPRRKRSQAERAAEWEWERAVPCDASPGLNCGRPLERRLAERERAWGRRRSGPTGIRLLPVLELLG